MANHLRPSINFQNTIEGVDVAVAPVKKRCAQSRAAMGTPLMVFGTLAPDYVVMEVEKE